MIRYPGGKTKLAKQIVSRIDLDGVSRYVEPFVGAGSVLSALKPKCRIWVNDLDIGMYAIWESLRSPRKLKRSLYEVVPSIDRYYKAIDDLAESDSIESLALAKIVVHQMSYSGLGLKAGSPIGGANQTGEYKIDCRWKPEHMCKKIDRMRELVGQRYRATCEEFETVIGDLGEGDFAYIDPPYYKQGSKLYLESMDHAAHGRLEEMLRTTKCKWLLSYDDCEETRNLYAWAKIEDVSASYTITGARRKTELLIRRES